MSITVRPCREDELPLVLAMSNDFVAEGYCNGMVPDALEDLQGHEMLLALDGETPVGYAYGDAETAVRSFGHARKGQLYFYLDEIYVKPPWRNTGVGRLLFRAMERRARELGCEVMNVTAVSKDYERLLRFYLREGMDFWSATMSMKL